MANSANSLSTRTTSAVGWFLILAVVVVFSACGGRHHGAGDPAAIEQTSGGDGPSGGSGTGTGTGTPYFVSTGEVVVNATTQGSQERPDIARLADGSYTVVWTHTDGSTGPVLFKQRYDPNGVKVGGEWLVNGSGLAESAAVTGLADGGYLATWTSGGSGADYYFQRFSQAAAPVGGPTLINSVQSQLSLSSHPTALADGGWLITWEALPVTESPAGPVHIYTKRYDATGTPVGSETLVGDSATERVKPATAALNDGGYVVAWQQNTSLADGTDIYALRFDSLGAPVGAATRINSVTAGTQFGADVAALASGGYVVVWETTGSRTLSAQVFNIAGAPVGGQSQLATPDGNQQLSPRVAGINDGGFVVTWLTATYQSATNTYHRELFAQRFASAGTAMGDALLVAATTATGQPFESHGIAATPGGGFVVTVGTYSAGSGWDVLMERFEPNP
jgi:hypothetical protein